MSGTNSFREFDKLIHMTGNDSKYVADRLSPSFKKRSYARKGRDVNKSLYEIQDHSHSFGLYTKEEVESFFLRPWNNLLSYIENGRFLGIYYIVRLC